MFALILKQKLNALRPEYQVTDHQDALHPSNQSKNRSQDNLPGKELYIILYSIVFTTKSFKEFFLDHLEI